MENGRSAENGRKTQQGMIRNYWYLCKGWLRHSIWNGVLFAISVLGGIALFYVTLYIPRILVELVTQEKEPGQVIGAVLFWGALKILSTIAANEGNILIKNQCLKYRHVLEQKVLEKTCTTAYSNLEDVEYRKQVDHARELYERWEKDVSTCIYLVQSFLIRGTTLLVSSGLLVLLHPVLVVAIGVCALLQGLADRHLNTWVKRHRDTWQPLEMKIEYIADKVSAFSHAKDLRLYEAEGWLMPKYRKFMEERRKWSKRQTRQEVAMSALRAVTATLRQFVTYGVLLYGILKGNLSAADFVFYLGVAGSLAGDLSGMTDVLRQMREAVWSIADYRKMMETPGPSGRGTGEVPAHSGMAPEITFSHVSFSYPGAGEETLKDIDFTVEPGEKIAVVGHNGAGKTTLIKLLCGMYEPTKGEIRLNGYPASRWDLESWYGMFSVVFQDVEVLPATIAENVAARQVDREDRKRVQECLEQAGLWERVEKLPRGMDTCLQKELFREGVNLSGGETQKLLLARAIYKESEILVLDEPTAALDALAENQLYLRYHELTKGRTSFFISHRLSSTRFCDRILVLEDGRITEEGSHEELMEKGGTYYHLFQVQSHYYRNDRTEAFESGLDPQWEVSSYVCN